VAAKNAAGAGNYSSNSSSVTPQPAFISTWKTDNTTTGSSTATQVRLPLESTGTYNFTLDWGDGSTSTITTWNDAQITGLNPGVNFPNARIVPCFRADSSGTTAIFTNYLAKVSASFQGGPGEGKSIRWPVGFGGKGNDGVSALLRQNRGAIGYVEVAYANKNKLTYAHIKNAKGNFIEPSLESATAAAEGAKLPSDFRAFITNSMAPQAYPITGFTWILIYPDAKPEVKKFLTWALTTGQKSAPALEYAPLPEAVRTRALKAIGQ
jgi:phosphate transport system substrate-binding protein